MTALEQERKRNEQLARDQHVEAMTAQAVDAQTTIESLKKHIKAYEGHITLATSIETAAAKMDPTIEGIGRVARQAVIENVAQYRRHWTAKKKDAVEALAAAEIRLKQLEAELTS